VDPEASVADDRGVRRRREPLTKQESRVVEVWRANGRTAATIQVYLYWVRRFSRSFPRGRAPVDAITLRSVRDFARRYAREREIDEARTFAGARSAVRAWVFAIRVLGRSPPSWSDAPAPLQVRPVVREYCDFRRHHRGVASSTIRTDVAHITKFLDHLSRIGRPLPRTRLIDIDAFVTTLRSRLKPRRSHVCAVRCGRSSGSSR
jgi:hypothetical protein